MSKIGIHYLVWTDGLTQSGVELAIEKSAEHGYNMIELGVLDCQKFNLDFLANKAKNLGLDVVVSMGLPEYADLSSENIEQFNNGKKYLENALKITRDLGGIRLCGVTYSMHGKKMSTPTKLNWQRSVEGIAISAEIAKQCNVQLALEVVNRFESSVLNTAAQGMQFLKEVDHENVFLHLDAFHMNIEEADPAGAIRLVGDKLAHYHIGESYRGYLGTGTIDFSSIFTALEDINYQGDIVFESFSTAVVEEKLSIVCGIWRNTWTDNNDLASQARKFIELKQHEAKQRKFFNNNF